MIDVLGRERERYKLPYGAVIKVADEAKVGAGDVIASWDPHTHPIITEVGGVVKFSGMDEGITTLCKFCFRFCSITKSADDSILDFFDEINQ